MPLGIVVPVTDWKQVFAEFSWFVLLPTIPDNGLVKDSGADASQVKSVSDARLVRRLGSLTDTEVEQIASAIALCVGY